MFHSLSPARQRLIPFAAAACVAALALTGCAAGSPAAEKPGTEEAATEPTFPAVAAAADLVPEAIRSSGTLRVAIPTNEPPTQFYREGTEIMTGVNPDVARLVAGALDLEIEIVVSNFDSIIPGLSADRFDMTVSSMSVTEERMEALDFVDYIKMGSALAVPAGNPDSLTFDTLCGKSLAMLTGSYQLTKRVPELNAACEAAGQPAPTVKQFKDTRQAISSMVAGRDDVVYADSPILGYAAKQNDEIEISDYNNISPVGMGISKKNELTAAVAAAMAEIIQSDEYREVLASYGLEDAAVDDARVNTPAN